MKYKKTMIVTLSIAGLLVLLFCVGKINISMQFTREVKALFSPPPVALTKKFSHEQLSGLPMPVQRYFKHVLPEGQPYITCARLTHDGQFKTGLDKDWILIKGEQYFITSTPGFIWKGTTALFTARDMYIADNGRLVVSLLSVFKIVDSSGAEINQGELLRWLAESVWFPTNLLPGERLQWVPIDNYTAKLLFHYNDLELFYIATFNDAGEITQLKTKRYMDKQNLETWIVKLADYKMMNGIRIPTRCEVLWKLKKEYYPYARFNIRTLEYEKPAKF